MGLITFTHLSDKKGFPEAEFASEAASLPTPFNSPPLPSMPSLVLLFPSTLSRPSLSLYMQYVDYIYIHYMYHT